MLACRRFLTHPVAGEIELPLLIPAFSSKGFIFNSTGKKNQKREYSEVAYPLAEFTRYPMPHILVSAYDLYFDHYMAPDLPAKTVMDYFLNTRILVIDSGGYELSSDFDSTEIKTYTYRPKDGYGKKEYESMLSRIRKDGKNLHLIITNYDHETRNKSLDEQIELARELFHQCPKCLHNFIIKPFTQDSKVVDPSKISKTELSNLKGCHIIGVTEKDLGTNIFDRLKRVAQLRRDLNEVGIDSPIHVWGGLDPVLTPLYFFAGADIFDGISWMRYAFINGVATNKQCYSILRPEIGVTNSHKLNEALSGHENLRYLENLTSALQQWVDFDGKNFNMFDIHIKANLQKAYSDMKTKIKYL